MGKAKRPPEFHELFAKAPKALQDEARDASEAIPPGVDQRAVRRILSVAARRERIHRMGVEARQDDGLQRDAASATKYLKRVQRHFDKEFFRPDFQRALDDLQTLLRPLIPPAPKGHPTMPHHTKALTALRALGVGPDEARAMLRAVGIGIRPTEARLAD